MPQTGSLVSVNRLRFKDPYGTGDICAAGIIPYTFDGLEVCMRGAVAISYV